MMRSYNRFILIFISFATQAIAMNLEQNLLKTWKNSPFYGFRGIRYGLPPVGNLRFKAPKPAPSWGDISAIFSEPLTQDGSPCPTPSNDANVTYNEDCLFLNVYTRNLRPDILRPVVVVIHPGGLYIGSGNRDELGPEYLLEHDIVLVTFNYRLHFFGFTSTGTKEAPGNAGFKDQVLALRWTRDHISHFGGDPNCVTVLGDSAGALSGALHLVSPMSQNLFHRLVLMSGGIFPQTKLSTAQVHLIEKFSKMHNCSKTNPFDCLREADTKTVTESLRKVFEFGWDNPVLPWLPVLEPKFDDEEQFLTEHPLQALKSGSFDKMPILVSTTKNELRESAMYLIEHGDLLAEWRNNFKKIGPICMQYEPDEETTNQIWDSYGKNFKQLDLESFELLERSFSDPLINFPTHRFLELVSQHSDVFYYLFTLKKTRDGPKNSDPMTKEVFEEISKQPTSEHCDDFLYLFPRVNKPLLQPNGSVEARTVERLTSLVFHFAKNGYPAVAGDETDWPKYDQKKQYIIFDDNLNIATHPFERSQLWDRLFPHSFSVSVSSNKN